MNPLISIIIPTYNRCDFLGETLNSVINQRFQNWECIIVDDESSDYTEELVDFYCNKDDRIKFFKRPVTLQKGANSCRNYGFKMSGGQFINWFDDDDIMLPDFINDKINILKPGVEIVICSFFPVDIFLNKKPPVKLNKTYSLFKSYALYELKLITNSLLFSREILKDKPLFLSGLEYGDETELFLRLFYQDPEPAHVILDKPLFLYRQHDASKSTQNENPNSVFRFSIIYVALQNLQRGVQMKDSRIIKFYYRRLISLFFKSLEANQKKNASYLLKEILPLVRRINKIVWAELLFWGTIFINSGRGSYKIEKRLKNYLN